MENHLPESDSESVQFGPTSAEVEAILRDYARGNGYEAVALLAKRVGMRARPVIVVATVGASRRLGL